METHPITGEMPTIDLADVADRLEALTAHCSLSLDQVREYEELLHLVAQTVRIDSCDYFTPVLYRHDCAPQTEDCVVDQLELTFFGTAYTAISTVAG